MDRPAMRKCIGDTANPHERPGFVFVLPDTCRLRDAHDAAGVRYPSSRPALLTAGWTRKIRLKPDPAKSRFLTQCYSLALWRMASVNI